MSHLASQRRDEQGPSGRKLIAWALFGLALVAAAMVWQSRRPLSAEDSVAAPPPDRATSGSVVASEKALYPAPSSSVLLDATASSVKEKPQPLFLVSTSPGRTPREGTAAIGINPKAPQTYSAGAVLLNGARLAEIHHRFVILERDGKLFRLALNAKTEVPDLALVGGASEQPKPVLATDRLSEVLRLSPVYENDLLVGLKVFPGTRSELLQQLGLRSGDILLAVNGAPIFEPGGMSALFEPLLQGGDMSVTARRPEGDLQVTLDGSVVSRVLDSSASAALPAANSATG